jgi:hypothetical protein
MIHLSEKPSATEVDHGRSCGAQAPRLFYHLSALRQRPLLPSRRLPHPVPRGAGLLLPGLARRVPQGLRPRLRPQRLPRLRQAGPALAPRRLQGHRGYLHHPPLLCPALHGGLHRRRREGPVPALLRRALLGPGAYLRPGTHVLVSPGGRPGAQQPRRHHPPPRRRARGSGGRRTPPGPRRGQKLHRHHGSPGLLPGGGAGSGGWRQRVGSSLWRFPAGGTEHRARLRAADGQHRRLGGHAGGLAGLVPLGGGPALLPARLAKGPRPRQAPQGAVPGAVGEGVAGLPRPGPAELRPEAAAASGVGAGAHPGGLCVGAGGEVVRARPGVRRGVPLPGRAPHQYHAGPGDAVHEPIL